MTRLDEAMVVLAKVGMLTERRAGLLVACDVKGDDPVAFARHLVKLIRAYNRPLPEPPAAAPAHDSKKDN